MSSAPDLDVSPPDAVYLNIVMFAVEVMLDQVLPLYTRMVLVAVLKYVAPVANAPPWLFSVGSADLAPRYFWSILVKDEAEEVADVAAAV